MAWDDKETNRKYSLRFSQDEYSRMIDEMKTGECARFIEIVDRVLKARFRKWRTHSTVVKYHLEEDLYSYILVKLLKASRNWIELDPDHFQAIVYATADKRFIDFICEEEKAHTFTVSLQTGGYSEDGEEQEIEIPDYDEGLSRVDTTDEWRHRLLETNNAIASCHLSFHKVVTWFLYLIALNYEQEQPDSAKLWMEREFSKKTLEEIVTFVSEHRAITYNMHITDEQIAQLKARLDKKDKNGARVGNAVYETFCMAGKTMRATISDWINRWYTWLKDNHIM